MKSSQGALKNHAQVFAGRASERKSKLRRESSAKTRNVLHIDYASRFAHLAYMQDISRRHFLSSSSAAALALAATPAILQSAEKNASAPLRMGLIGCGGYGMANARAALKAGGVTFTCVCDVDSDHLQKSGQEIAKLQGTAPRTFKLYQEMLALPDLDAVIIASPPHWHALQLIAALDRGLEVYLEKPLCYDIREGRAMVEAVSHSKRVVQVGFQRRQSPAFKAVRERVQSGECGRVVSVDANIHYTAGVTNNAPQEPPAALDWDLWCGPAPKIPYSPQVGHVNWRLEKTTGHGHLVDWGIHLIDAARFILKEGMPNAVTASGGLYALKGKITTPDTLNAHFEFASCPLTWRHRIWGAQEYAPQTSNGITFFCEKETIFVTDDRHEIIPRGKESERETKRATADMGVEHMKEFLTAVRERKAPACSVQEAYESTTCVKLAMISYDMGTKIVWDAANEQVVGNNRAASLLKRDYRQPWKHPSKG